jgi:hypothetical protein
VATQIAPHFWEDRTAEDLLTVLDILKERGSNGR